MDKFTDFILEKTGLLGMIGKAERGPVAVEAIKSMRRLSHGRGRGRLPGLQGHHQCPGRGLPELGMEAIYEFEVRDMPVTVAVDSKGVSVHETGPKLWKEKIQSEAIKLIG